MNLDDGYKLQLYVIRQCHYVCKCFKEVVILP